MKHPYPSRLLLLLLLLLLLVVPVLSYAQPNISRVYKIVNRASGEVLDAGSSDVGSDHYNSYNSILAKSSNSSASQQWKFVRKAASGTNVYEIINRSSGQVLTVPYSSTSAGTYVVQNNRTGGTNNWQLWQLRRLTGVSAISYELVVHATNLLLSNAPVNYGQITQNDPGAGGQVWDLVDVSPNPTNDPNQGVYVIANVRSGMLLETGTEWLGKDKVYQQADAGIGAQEWRFRPSSTYGYYHIINRTFPRALEIGGAAQQDLYNQGRLANLWDDWGGNNQQWRIEDAFTRRVLTLEEARQPNQYCVLINRHTGQCLEMGGGGNYPLQPGRTPNQWPYVRENNQMWVIQYRAANRTALSTSTASEQTAATGQGELSLYPNPAQTTVALTLPAGKKPTLVEVFDLRGARITTARYEPSAGQLNVAALAPGVYVVSASDGTHTFRHKLLKQ